jgi:hypothetical protein
MIDLDNADENELLDVMNYACKEEFSFVVNTIKENEYNRVSIKGTPYFKKYWKSKSRKLFIGIDKS